MARRKPRGHYQPITAIAESKAEIERIRRLDEERRAEFITGILEEKRSANAIVSKRQRVPSADKAVSKASEPALSPDNDEGKASYFLLLKFWQSPLGISLDHQKLVNSQNFHKLLTYAVSQVRMRKNLEPAQNIARIFERTRFFEPVMRWFCDAGGLDYSLTNEAHLKFSARLTADGLRPVFTDYLTKFSGDIRDVFRSCETVRIDMLDSPLRVSGSYGSGKRR